MDSSRRKNHLARRNRINQICTAQLHPVDPAFSEDKPRYQTACLDAQVVSLAHLRGEIAACRRRPAERVASRGHREDTVGKITVEVAAQRQASPLGGCCERTNEGRPALDRIALD